MQVQPLGQEDPLEEKMAAHSSIPAWEIPWTEERGRLQSMGSQKRLNNSSIPWGCWYYYVKLRLFISSHSYRFLQVFFFSNLISLQLKKLLTWDKPRIKAYVLPLSSSLGYTGLVKVIEFSECLNVCLFSVSFSFYCLYFRSIESNSPHKLPSSHP